MDITRDTLMGPMSTNTMKVTFIKVSDGSVRDMICTTRFDKIPSEFHPDGKSHVTYDLAQCRVFDLEKNAWRSFRIENVISAEIVTD